MLLLVDSGSGQVQDEMLARLQLEILARLQLKGIYIKPGVPNTTHITQQNDQNYGMFIKPIYCINIKLLTKHTTSIQTTAIPLLVLGSELKNKDGLLLCNIPSAFEATFSFYCNQEVWKELGFFPFTQACLLDVKVKHEVVVLVDGL